MEPAPGTWNNDLFFNSVSFFSIFMERPRIHERLCKAAFLRKLMNGGLIFCRRILQIHQNTSFFQILILFQGDRWPKALVTALNVFLHCVPSTVDKGCLFLRMVLTFIKFLIFTTKALCSRDLSIRYRILGTIPQTL